MSDEQDTDRTLEAWEVGSRQPDKVQDAQESVLKAALALESVTSKGVTTGPLHDLIASVRILRKLPS